MAIRKFNAGDKVCHKDRGYVGTIVSGDDANGYSVHYPCDDEEYHVSKDEIEFVDAKSVFLSCLQSLLREFDVEIFAINGIVANGIGIKIGCEDVYYKKPLWNMCTLTASNIMDFEK